MIAAGPTLDLTVEERVSVGVDLLDQQIPDWDLKITPHTLDISVCPLCVLGQVFGRFEVGADRLFGPEPGSAMDSYRHGFVGLSSADYVALNVEWRRVIGERRAGGAS